MTARLRISSTAATFVVVVFACACIASVDAAWLGLSYGPFFEFQRITDAVKKFYANTQGATRWPQQFKGGWEVEQPCAWNGNERQFPAPWGTRCLNGGWHRAPPHGDGGLLYIEHYSGFAEGPVPEEFDALQMTDVIGLAHNRLTGTLWNTSFHTFLHRLDLAHNRMSGTLGTDFMQRNNLHAESINLYDNQFSGTIPPGIRNLKVLTALLLGKNRFSGTVPDLSDNKQMRHLDLSENQLSGTLGPWLKELPNLGWLMLQDNQFEGGLPELPPRVSRVLLGGSNKWSGSVPVSYGSLGYMRVFNCTGCKVTCPKPDLLQHVPFSTHCKTPANQ